MVSTRCPVNAAFTAISAVSSSLISPINITSGSLSRLTYNDTFDSFPVFSKNGKKIVFSSNRDAENPRNTNIFIADIVDK